MMPVEVAERERLEGGRLAELYREHAPAAFRLAYLVTGDRGLAEDLVQDAFVRVAGRFLDVRDRVVFGLYLRRTVINLANSWFRRRKVEQVYLERFEPMSPISAPDIGERDELWRALHTLPLRQRAAIVLRYYEDLSEEAIALVLGCRPGTVKSLTSRGLDALRRLMRGE